MYTPPTQPSKKKVVPFALLQVFIVLLSISIGYWLYSRINSAPRVAQREEPAVKQPVVAPPVALPQQEPGPETVIEKNQLTWQAWEPVPNPRIQKMEDSVDYPTTFSRIALVTDGPYKGGEIIAMIYNPEGIYMWIAKPMDRFLKFGETYYLLGRHSDTRPTEANREYITAFYDLSRVNIDTNIIVTGLDSPPKLQDVAAERVISNRGAVSLQFDDYIKDKKVALAFNSAQGPVYEIIEHASVDGMSMLGAFALKLADGTFHVYNADPLITDDTGIPNVIWNTKERNTSQYVTQDPGGCGFSNFISVLRIKNPALELTATGTTIGHQSPQNNVYEFKDTNNPVLKAAYAMYTSSNAQGGSDAAVSYAQFVKSHPVFLWKDGFGRYVKFSKQDFMSSAECGKPVIYLYPKQTTSVDVKVVPEGGMSYSDPVHGDGWKVIADPQSQITNRADGKVYPYLFWEGTGGMYAAPSHGWVIKKSEVHMFLIEKLTAMGLNAQEIADFVDFWEPRMQKSPYYFVGFHGTRVMDELAPLTISPKPDTVIRVLMDFKELDKPINVEAPSQLSHPPRTGFTVIEWGGVLRGQR